MALSREEISQIAKGIAERVIKEAVFCGSHGYEFAIHIGKAMRELHMLEAGEIGFPSGAIFTAERFGRELGQCTGIPLAEQDKITEKLYLAKERVEQGKYDLARLAVEDANDTMAIELAKAKGKAA